MSDKRSTPRTKKRLSCRLRLDGRSYPGIVLDVSATGLFVQTGATAAPGTKLAFDLQLPDGSSLPLRATVMRRRNVPANLRSVAHGGIGLVLDEFPDAYYALIEELQGERDAGEPALDELQPRVDADATQAAPPEPEPEPAPPRSDFARKALLSRLKKLRSEAG